jgi:hypothetical protein
MSGERCILGAEVLEFGNLRAQMRAERAMRVVT